MLWQLPYIEHGLLEVPEWRLIIRYLDNAFPDKALKAPTSIREVRLRICLVRIITNPVCKRLHTHEIAQAHP